MRGLVGQSDRGGGERLYGEWMGIAESAQKSALEAMNAKRRRCQWEPTKADTIAIDAHCSHLRCPIRRCDQTRRLLDDEMIQPASVPCPLNHHIYWITLLYYASLGSTVVTHCHLHFLAMWTVGIISCVLVLGPGESDTRFLHPITGVAVIFMLQFETVLTLIGTCFNSGIQVSRSDTIRYMQRNTLTWSGLHP